MQAVILAAGKGTRMGDLTKSVPKPLLKINSKTLLEHNLAALPDAIDEVIIVIGYLGDQIKSVLGDNFNGKKIIYIEQDEAKGTADALFIAKDRLNDRFLVVYGDDMYSREDLQKLVKEDLAVLVSEIVVDDLSRIGPATVKVDDAGYVLDIVERLPVKKGGLVNTGAYVLDKRFFDYDMVPWGNPPKEFGLPQTMISMIKDGAKVKAIKGTGWRRISEPEDLN